MEKQSTIASQVNISGHGLHTGKTVNISLLPAPENYGIRFQRIDLSDQPFIKAHITNVFDTSRGTFLCENNAEVKTVEHLLAALAGCAIDNMLIKIDAEEIPILDGSSKIFYDAIMNCGIHAQNALRKTIVIDEPVHLQIPEKGIELNAYPADSFSLEVTVDYGTRVLSAQKAILNNRNDFYPEIYSCRTFVFLHEIQFLIDNNLAKGGDVNNAIVFVDKMPDKAALDKLANFFNKKDIHVTANGTLDNVQLQYDNEPARHKLLDLVGDLYLLGRPLQAKIVANKPGHLANTQFASLIYQKLI